MKKRWMSLVLTVIMVLSLAGCGKSTELSSVSRDPATDDGTVWFDEEAVALAGSVRKAGMSEAELARADELRAMAIDALDIVNAKRAENGLAALNSELMWGENLAKGYDSAQSVVDAWMASPTHAANILAGDFTTCSIAVYETNGKLYFAQEFGY